jgi:hypothetical protein
MKASRAVVFPSNFWEPMVKRKGEAVAQEVTGILPTAKKISRLKGTPNPLFMGQPPIYFSRRKLNYMNVRAIRFCLLMAEP